ncbi:MAG: toprim domain-containing protein [Gallionella sp.]|jgi:putative DNA primase/helicase|nr:toprim domain-containing protein [Gallionella sp.]
MIDLDQYRAAAAARGIILPDTIDADGRIHRCRVEGGKSGRKDGSYAVHRDTPAAGGFENWRDGLGWQTWHAKPDQGQTPEDLVALRTRIEAVRQQRQAEVIQRHTEAAQRAARLLSRCKPATNDHAYLRRKGVNAYGIRQLREQLVIPVRDVHGGLWSLQFIGIDGSKKFLTGGRKRGCYFAIGVPRRALCICEGYATGASIFEATGHATAVAFDAGNLEPVARALREKFPDLNIILCADNDTETPGNPGLSRAAAAAQAVHGCLAVPRFDTEHQVHQR